MKEEPSCCSCPYCGARLRLIPDTSREQHIQAPLTVYDDANDTEDQEQLALSPEFSTALHTMNSTQDPTPEMLRENIDIRLFEITPNVIRTRHRIDPPLFLRYKDSLRRLGFDWISAGAASHFRRRG